LFRPYDELLSKIKYDLESTTLLKNRMCLPDKIEDFKSAA